MFDISLIPEENLEQVTAIAKVCYEVVRSYSISIKEHSSSWDEAEQHHRDKAIAGVALYIVYPELKASGRHDNWMAIQQSKGWTYGKKFNLKAKKHHALKPFHHLPTEQQAKEYIFHSIVHQSVHAA